MTQGIRKLPEYILKFSGRKSEQLKQTELTRKEILLNLYSILMGPELSGIIMDSKMKLSIHCAAAILKKENH